MGPGSTSRTALRRTVHEPRRARAHVAQWPRLGDVSSRAVAVVAELLYYNEQRAASLAGDDEPCRAIGLTP